MRIAILYDNEEVCVEYPPKEFRKLLKEYMARSNDIDTAMDLIERELKQLTLSK